MKCANALPLIPIYQDGELSEEQASPLRRHLLSCRACREVAKAETALKRWMVPAPAVAIPSGFAARVARRAFAGDPGLLPAAPARADEPQILAFVLRLSVAAALLLLGLATALRWRELPASDNLEAMSLSEVIEYLEPLNEAETAPDQPAPGPEPAPEGERAE